MPRKRQKKLPAWVQNHNNSVQRAKDRIDWARALCQVLIFWHERHPEAVSVYRAESAQRVLTWLSKSAYPDFSIDRDKRGFKTSFFDYREGHKYFHITMDGLPALNWPAEEQ